MKAKYDSMLSAAVDGSQTRNNPIRRKWFLLPLGGLLFISIFALPALAVQGQCNSWDVSGKWTFKQGSGQRTIDVIVHLRQQGSTVITGTAVHQPIGGYLTRGTVDGTVEGDLFNVKIYWENDSIGVYEGAIRPTGRIEGQGWEQASRKIKLNWHSVGVMKCGDTKAVEPTNPTPKPIKKAANPPVAPTPRPISKSGKTQASAAGAPTITAHPTVLTIPEGRTEGTVTLTWDGGPGHPDARPWLKEGIEGEEVMVAAQGQGTRRLSLERGKNYQFLLKDAGQQLAKAVVISKR